MVKISSFGLAVTALFASAVSARACVDSESEIGVQGGAQTTYCVRTQQMCVADLFGECPQPQADLYPYGSYCGIVDSGVHGCIKLTADSVRTFEPQVYATDSLVLVDGTNRTFPVTGVFCSNYATDGNCPVPQKDLENGAYCDLLDSGDYGCKAVASITPVDRDCSADPAGPTPVSVVGTGTFCASGVICSGDISNGTCPPSQAGLDMDSRCVWISTGVYGCVV